MLFLVIGMYHISNQGLVRLLFWFTIYLCTRPRVKAAEVKQQNSYVKERIWYDNAHKETGAILSRLFSMGVVGSYLCLYCVEMMCAAGR